MLSGHRNSKLILYPSNWLYNASVIGLLKVLEFGGKKGFEFQEGGEVELESELLKESYSLITNYHKEKLGEDFKIQGKNIMYPNYIQPKESKLFENGFVKALSTVSKSKNGKPCAWCMGMFIDDMTLESIRKKFKFDKEPFGRFLNRREIFQFVHIPKLGPSIGEMPNALWNPISSIPICHLCSYLVIFHHLAFSKLNSGEEIFINAPSFRVIWDLNKFAESTLSSSQEYWVTKVLASSLLQWSIKRRSLLGSWTVNNIEVVVINRRIRRVDHFDLPWEVTKILLDYKVASLVLQIGEEKIFDIILSGKFSELEKINYFVLRAIKKIKIDGSPDVPAGDPVINYISNRKLYNLIKISEYLPELSARIQCVLRREQSGKVY